MAEYDYRLAVGAHPEIQLSALLAQLENWDRRRNRGQRYTRFISARDFPIVYLVQPAKFVSF